MGLFSFIRGELIDVIEWPNQEDDILIWKFPRKDNEIKMGAQLTVREGQSAIFLNEGKMADVFGPGRHELTTRNMPLMTTLKSWKYGFDSPFKADIYFVNQKHFRNMKWGTRNPIPFTDPEYSIVNLRAFGSFNFRIGDAATFFKEFAGNQPDVDTAEVLDDFRSSVVTEFSSALKKSGKSINEIFLKSNDLGDDLLPILQEDFNAFGLELTKFLVENVSLPEEIQQEIRDQDMELRKLRKSGSIQNELEMQNLMGKAQLSQNVGDMDKFMKFQMASGMDNPQGEGGQGGGGNQMQEMMQMMMGMGMANNMMQNMQGSVMSGTMPNPRQQQQQQQQQQPQQQPADGDGDGGGDEQQEIMTQLKQLGELKEAGILTDEEFEAKKADLLSRL